MDFNSIINLIGSLGFPMAVCIYLIYNKNKYDEKNTEVIQNFSLNIQENTLLLKQMMDLIDKLGKKE